MSSVWVGSQGEWPTCEENPVASSGRGAEQEKKKKMLTGWIFVSPKGVPPRGHRDNRPEAWGPPFLFTLANEGKNQQNAELKRVGLDHFSQIKLLKFPEYEALATSHPLL